ncbi:MAG TPA: CGNR zinc finger domain-containing protein [Acidimicrobiales bacterium]|nr:CGNR zinc finger domain-containing protein [Acidimicrobiales bacterium]
MPEPRLTERLIPRESSEYACLDLVNSAFAHYLEPGEEALDRLPDRDWQAWFMARHDLALAQGAPFPLTRLRSARTLLRSTLEEWAREGTVGPAAVARLDAGVRQVSLRNRVKPGPDQGAVVYTEPTKRDGASLVAAVTVSAVILISTGQPERLKICRNPNCSWMFFDDTLNRSKVYCSVQPCGTLMRVRRHRAGKRARG